MSVQPAPYSDSSGSYRWNEWYRQIQAVLDGVFKSLNGIDDVSIAGITDGELLQYQSSSSKWLNKTLTEISANLGDIDSITQAKGGLIVSDGTDYIAEAVGANDTVLVADSAQTSGVKWGSVNSIGWTLATPQATTSGTSKTFSSIPSGVSVIHVMFDGVSLTSNNNVYIRIGDSGGIETTGYKNSSGTMTTSGQGVNSSTVAFELRLPDAANLLYGSVILSLENSTNNVWCAQGVLGTNDATIVTTGGRKALSGELTQVQIVASGGSFDAGEVNIQYA